MTPDWNQAPEWAQWVAMDSDGAWWWYGGEPQINGAVWNPVDGCECAPCDVFDPICHPRPTTEDER